MALLHRVQLSNYFRNARRVDEAGIYMSFEEESEELVRIFASLGFDLNDLAARKRRILDHMHIDLLKSGHVCGKIRSIIEKNIFTA